MQGPSSSAPPAPPSPKAPETAPGPGPSGVDSGAAPAENPAPSGGPFQFGGGGGSNGGKKEPPVRLPKEVLDKLKGEVFGFDTFWVTETSNYGHEGVVFKGNVRGKDPALSYTKMCERLQASFPDKYELFLLEDKDEKPTIILLPKVDESSAHASAPPPPYLAPSCDVL